MFERGKKSDEFNGSEDAVSGQQAEKGLASTFRSKTTERGSSVAVIGSSIQINGDLRGDEDLRIEGNVSGTVMLKNSALTIGKNGKVKAGVYAKAIAVDGETKGDLHATECVSVHANARVQGNIIAPRVSIVEGAHFKGSIEMDPDAVSKALGESPAPKKAAEVRKASSPATTKAASKTTSEASRPQAKSA